MASRKKQRRSAPAAGGAPGAWGAQTRMIHGGVLRSDFKETAEAIYLTSGYVYENAEEAEAAFANTKPRFIYSRFSNPTVQMFETRMAELERAEAARATASGMAAVFASLMCQLKAGDRVVSSDALFGSCQYVIAEILPRFGIEAVLVDGRDLGAWRKALSKPTAAVFLETPSNPGLRIVDLPAVAKLAHAAGACVIVDNVSMGGAQISGASGFTGGEREILRWGGIETPVRIASAGEGIVPVAFEKVDAKLEAAVAAASRGAPITARRAS